MIHRLRTDENGRLFDYEERDGRFFMPKQYQEGIIIPNGYEDVIVPEGEFGKLVIGKYSAEIKQHAEGEIPKTNEHAAQLRDVPLYRELRSVLMETSDGHVLVNILSDQEYQHNKLKHVLNAHTGTKNVRPEQRTAILADFFCEYGTINPFGLNHLLQVVDTHVLSLAQNNETFTQNPGVQGRSVEMDARMFIDSGKLKDVVIANIHKCKVCNELIERHLIKDTEQCDICKQREKDARTIMKQMIPTRVY